MKTKTRKRSLTDRMMDEIAKAAPLSRYAKTYDKDTIVKHLFPRTIEDVCIMDSSGKKAKTTKSVIFDSGCNIQPHDVGGCGDNLMSLYNQLRPNNINDRVIHHFQDNFAWLGWLTCATLAQHPLISRACSIPGEDAVAAGYKLTLLGDGDTETTSNDMKARKLMAETKRMGIPDVLRTFDSNKRVFGVGICVPCFNHTSESAKKYIERIMSLPFNIDALKRRNDISYVGMKVVDPYWLTPVFDSKSGMDPTSKDFYKPTWWQLGNTSRKIHKTWCFSFVNTIVSDLLKPTYYYGGMPLPQMLMERLYSADKVADEAQLLAMSKRLLVVDANVQKLVANPKEAAKVMDALKFARDNWGVFFKNPNTNVQQVDTYITEFNQLIMTQYQLVASIAQIPAPKLLKVMPTGFSDISELVWKDYAQQVASIQEDEFDPILNMHYTLHLLLNHGSEKEFDISFNPIDVPTMMEKAKIAELEAKAARFMVEQGVLSPKEVRQVIRSKKGGEYCGIKGEQDAGAIRKDVIKATKNGSEDMNLPVNKTKKPSKKGKKKDE